MAGEVSVDEEYLWALETKRAAGPNAPSVVGEVTRSEYRQARRILEDHDYLTR